MSTKSWQEEFRNKWQEFSSSIKRTLNVYDNTNKVEICALCGVNADELGNNIEQFITDIRKHDEEELIKIVNDFFIGDGEPSLDKLIKQYYEK